MRKKKKKIELKVSIGTGGAGEDSGFVVDLREKEEKVNGSEGGDPRGVESDARLEEGVSFRKMGEMKGKVMDVKESVKEKFENGVEGFRDKLVKAGEVVGEGGRVREVAKVANSRLKEGVRVGVESAVRVGGEKVRDLFFVKIIRVLFGFFRRVAGFGYRIVFMIGWFFVFFGKFFWLLFLKVFSPVRFVLRKFKIDFGRLGGSSQRRVSLLRGRSVGGWLSGKQCDAKLKKTLFFKILVASLGGFIVFKFLKKVFRFWETEFKSLVSEDKRGTKKRRVAEAVKKGKDVCVGRKNVGSFRFGDYRKVLRFTMILGLLILPFKLMDYYVGMDLESRKNSMLSNSREAIGQLMDAANAAKSMEFGDVDASLSGASDNFLSLQRELDDINGFLFTVAKYVPNKEVQLAGASRSIIASGQIATDMARNLNLAMENLLDENKNKNIYSALENFNKYIQEAIREAELLAVQLEKIDEGILPGEYREEFVEVKGRIASMRGSFSDFSDIAMGVHELLGMTRDKRYLLLFQNNTEARATGGFVGSYALVDFRNGKIRNLEVPEGGSYDTEGGMRVMVAAPAPMQLVNPLWHFWDANWWPDWPKSARKMAWFYEKSGGPTVDGVVSFTPTFFEEILEIVGPIKLDDYGIEITGDNFWETVQTIIEEVPNKNNPAYLSSDANKPKKIIGDLAHEVLEVMPERLDREKLVRLVKIVNDSLHKRHVLFYFVDKELQGRIEKYGWSGRIKETAWDYLNVINTNIAGQKTDRVIDQKISLKTEVSDDGIAVNTLTIERKHNGKKGDNYTGVRNVNWLRVYVPRGSLLIESGGFDEPDSEYFEEPDGEWLVDDDLVVENNAVVGDGSGTKIYEESGKTVFANWTMIDPGDTQEIVFIYQLPFKVGVKEVVEKEDDRFSSFFDAPRVEIAPYALMVQKQAGFKDGEFESVLELAPGMRVVWKYPRGMHALKDGWNIKETLDGDKYYALMMGH